MQRQSVAIERLQPTQDYLCKTSLAYRTASVQPTSVTAYRINGGRFILVDGHHETFVAYQRGSQTVEADVYDLRELNKEVLAAYLLELIRSARHYIKQGITTIVDLEGKLLPTKEDIRARAHAVMP